MASRLGYASASGHGARGPGTNIAGGTINGGRPAAEDEFAQIEQAVVNVREQMSNLWE